MDQLPAEILQMVVSLVRRYYLPYRFHYPSNMALETVLTIR